MAPPSLAQGARALRGGGPALGQPARLDGSDHPTQLVAFLWGGAEGERQRPPEARVEPRSALERHQGDPAPRAEAPLPRAFDGARGNAYDPRVVAWQHHPVARLQAIAKQVVGLATERLEVVLEPPVTLEKEPTTAGAELGGDLPRGTPRRRGPLLVAPRHGERQRQAAGDRRAGGTSDARRFSLRARLEAPCGEHACCRRHRKNYPSAHGPVQEAREGEGAEQPERQQQGIVAPALAQQLG